MKRKLKCDMKAECANPVTHIEDKGWVYCTEHATLRRGIHRIRKMQPWEIRRLEAGKPLQSYEPITLAESLRRDAQGK